VLNTGADFAAIGILAFFVLGVMWLSVALGLISKSADPGDRPGRRHFAGQLLLGGQAVPPCSSALGIRAGGAQALDIPGS